MGFGSLKDEILVGRIFHRSFYFDLLRQALHPLVMGTFPEEVTVNPKK
jgi:hypothetical protein